MDEAPKTILGQQKQYDAVHRQQQRPYQQGKKKASLEEALQQLATNTSSFMMSTKTNFKNQVASIHNLELQVGQIANLLANRPQGSLLNNTGTNPKEDVKAITLRSGKTLEQN